jgi:hypothetical protein
LSVHAAFCSSHLSMVLLRSVNATISHQALSPQDTNQGKARSRSPLLHGEPGDAPVPNAFDPYCMGHHLCWHCLGPPLSKPFAGILFPCPVQYSMGVAGTPSCLKSIRNQLPKRLLLFLPLQPVCRHNRDVPKFSYVYKQAPTAARSLLCSSSGRR